MTTAQPRPLPVAPPELPIRNTSRNGSKATTGPSTPPTSGANGWNYDASNGRFWANSNTVGENAW